jgi:hypothetical protein
MGKLAYLEYDTDREKPVYFKWQILNWNPSHEVKNSLQLSFNQRPLILRERKSGLVLTQKPPSLQGEQRKGLKTEQFRYSQIDYEDLSAQNTELGKKGELATLEYEKNELIRQGYPHLADRVKLTSENMGTDAPYDILSFNPEGREKFIEVKTTAGDYMSDFFISARELDFSESNQKQYYLYRLFSFDQQSISGKIYIVQGNMKKQLRLIAKNYRAAIR